LPRATPLTIRFLKRLPLFASITAILIAVAALTGWWLDITVLTRVVPWAAPMLPQTAVATGLAGLGLALAGMEQRWGRTVAFACAVIVALMSTFTFGAHDLPGGDAIERLFFSGGHAPDHLQIPVNTAMALLLLGVSIAMLTLPRLRERRATQLFAAGALLIAFVAFVGYAFGVGGLYQPTSALGMSVLSVIAIHAVALGVIFARSRVGFPELLIDRGPGGRLARRLLPAAIVIPFIVAWVVAQGERAHYFDAYLASSLATVLTVIALVWISARGARVVQRTDRERAQVFAREQHEREVAQQALIAAETASSAKSDFLAVMSHELRTPLTAIIGYEELLADEVTGPVSAQQAQQLSRIKASAQHLLGLIDEILTFSRLEAGRETIRLETADVNRIIEDAASLISPLAGEKKLGFAVYPLDPPRQMRVDSGKLRQILVNMMSNAVKFTSQGGITLTTAVDAGELVVRVCDTGVGIAEDYLDRIFEPFWQVEQKATRRVGGTGLGLTVTRRLARLLGGDVTVESAPGEGTVFTATIPGVIPLAATVPVEAAEPPRAAARA
jgi:signal transduction histidine kinase